MGAEPVAEDFRADVLLGKGQRHAAIAGADQIGFLQHDGERRFDHLLDVSRRRFDRRFARQHAGERAAELVAQLARGRPVFHFDNGFVVDVEQQVVGKLRLLRHLLGMRVVARAGDVAEEVGLALGAGGVKLGRFLAQPAEHLDQRILHAGFEPGKALALDLAAAGLLQIVELFEELLKAEGPLQRAEKGVEIDLRMRVAQRPAEQRELPVDIGFLARYARCGGVVRARIGDAAADDLAVLVENDGLGRRRTKIDADKRLHAVPLRPPRPRRRVSGRSSGNSSPDGS